MTVREFVTIVRQHKKLSFAILVLVLVLGKIVSVSFGMCGIGTFGGE